MAVLLPAVAGLLACSQGYQGDDSPVRLHHDMTLEETISAMELLGQAAPVGGSRYRLQANCTLQWRAGLRVRTIPLREVEPNLEKLPDGPLFQVSLKPKPVTHPVEAVTVVSEVRWIDATQMKWLLDYVRRFC